VDGIQRRRFGPPVQRRAGAVARLRSSTATSAGGIVVRFDDGIPSLVVGARRRDRDTLTWTLPKGTPNTGETREETAVREVGEETGLEVRITDGLDSIEYWFVQRGTRIHKTVHYFLMEPIGGDLSRHDHEFDQVRWVRFDEAPDLLAFETERALVARAAEVVDPPGAAQIPGAGEVAAASVAGSATPSAVPSSAHSPMSAGRAPFGGA
jgi:8-oxo-dGTP pyrophosphatase MutT (NUDIX family)